jgi:hypothetical protein
MLNRKYRTRLAPRDLTLRFVERYYGPDVARDAAYTMEYRRTARPQSASAV